MPVTRRRSRRRTTVFLLGTVLTQVGFSQASFQGIGMLPGGTSGSAISAISANGQVVVGVSSSTSGNQAYRWQAGIILPLGTLAGGNFSESFDISEHGGVIVGAGTSLNGYEAFRWNGAMVGLGDLPLGSVNSTGTAISADGSVIVGTGTTNLGFEAFRYSNSLMQGLGYLTNSGTRESYARDVSADGVVIVGASTSSFSGPSSKEAFMHRNGVMQGLGDLPGGAFDSVAFGVSSEGDHIVGYSRSAQGKEAFHWYNGTMTGLGDLPGGVFESAAYKSSLGGERIVGWTATSAQYEAFLWDAVNGMRSVRSILTDTYGLGASLVGWHLTYATGISDDGNVIVGWGTNPQGISEGWIATITGTSNVSGKIVLANYSGSVGGEPIMVEVTRSGDQTVRQTASVLLDANGDYQFSTLGVGNFDIYVKSSHYLRRKISSVAIGVSGASGVNATLTNGDCDGDNEVTLVDLGYLSSAFGSSLGDSNFLANCDLDGDDEVNLLDVAILSHSFGQSGD